MSATTKDKLEFTHAMARHTRATVRQCEALMRYAATLQRLAEDDCNRSADDVGLARRWAKRKHIQDKVRQLCIEIGENDPTLSPYFQNDPRGAVLKIRVPDGYTNDMGREGICVPS